MSAQGYTVVGAVVFLLFLMWAWLRDKIGHKGKL
jgi:hypothetical protein